MARPTLTMMRAAVVVALASRAVAQTCYYPNGNPAPDSEKPCSSAQGSACCPDTWECLDNGLCHLPTNNLYGRYSCTDKDWNSPGCPSNMCTYGGTAFGAEGIEQCSNHNNNWCCNADRTNVNCCQESPSPRPFFQLQDGKAYATIGRNQASSAPTLSSVTGLASGSASAAASRTSAPASSGRVSSASRAVSSASPVTSIQTSVSSGPAGVVTIERTTVITPTSVPNNDGGSATTSGGSSSNIGVIVGCAVGIPMALALFGIVFWLLRKRRQQKVNPYKNEAGGDSTNSPGMAAAALRKFGKKDVYRHSRPGTAEIDGNPAGPGRPVSEIPGHAELESGAGFRPGHGSAYAPDTVGIGGGNTEGRSTWGSPPPTYSPGTNSTAFPAAVELDGSSSLPAINEKTEAPQQYQAYRPPQAAELPTAKTPPEDLEKQLQK